MLNVVYEDNHIIVVEKPTKIPSQADKSGKEDMLTIIKKYIKEKYNKPGNVYLGLVHRLDTMTAGIMVFAKTSKAASRLSESIRVGDFKKKYLAVVIGKLPIMEENELEDFLVKDEKNNLSSITVEGNKNAKKAKLRYKCIQNFVLNGKDLSFVEVELLTGRHHQIRVQFANINHPLYGDIKYGGGKGELYLYAYSLKFVHPTKDEYMEFTLMPKDSIWKELREDCL